MRQGLSSGAFALVAVVSIVVLFSPQQAGPELFPHIDKVVHASLFAALAVTAGWRFGRRRPVLLLVAAYAPVSELIQAFALSDRSGDWRDVLADLAGAALGCALLGAALRRSNAFPAS